MKKYFLFALFFLFEQKINCKFNFKDKFNKISNFSTKNKVILGLSTAALLGISLYKGYKYLNKNNDLNNNDDQIIESDDDKMIGKVNILFKKWFEIPTFKGDKLKNHLLEMHKKDNLISGISNLKLKIDVESNTQENVFIFLKKNEPINNNYTDLFFFKKNESFLFNENGNVLSEKDYDMKPFKYYNLSDDNTIELNAYFFDDTSDTDIINYRNDVQNFLKKLNDHTIKKKINEIGLKINFDEENFIIIDVDYDAKKPYFYEKLSEDIKKKYSKTLNLIYNIEIPENLLQEIQKEEQIQQQQQEYVKEQKQ